MNRRENSPGTSGADGTCVTRGFKGDYKIMVSQNGKTASATARIGDVPGEVRVVLK